MMIRHSTLRVIARRAVGARVYSTSTDNPIIANDPKPQEPHHSVSSTNTLPSHGQGNRDRALQESVEQGKELKLQQAPNRATIWSRSQQPRAKAMVGPRFEQTIMEDQPRPLAAIELIHKQPVHWTKKKVVSCDGGGGPLGHPRVFINTDKPQIAVCGYCGVPFANEHHRKHLESLPSTPYPLAPTADAATLPQSHIGSGEATTGSTLPYQSNTGIPYEQR
ncbi:hypothetical protein AMS68_007636 [Peltaster fructicola]|uniref:Zinc finger CHCC-type domain-containing protein n=1 Tax=Peltaster fructicola TaxID=286661 RepID=A0A6H0Y5L1_9PEZI|nr:hypothetical protein AMS68_007636 [Peltaster fructicola]